MSYRIFPFFILVYLTFTKCQLETKNIDNQNITPKKGQVINQSTRFQNGEFQVIASNDAHENIITIEGDSLIVDFNNLTLIGTEDLTKPDEFKGVAIFIKNSK